MCGLWVVNKKTKSSVWRYFSLLATEDGKVIEKDQEFSVYGPSSPQAKDLNRAVAYHIAKDAVPLSTVDRPGFRFMVSKLNPRYQLPSRRHFSDSEIPSLYSHVRDNVVAPMLKQAKFYAATTDMWTSSSNDSYITVTVHFISSNWDLQSFCLHTVPVFTDHTGQNTADAITDILDNWGLSRNDLVATTTDSGSNIVSAFRILSALRISCFGHNLDLGIKKGLDNAQIKRAIGRCHSLVELFHRSCKKTRDLRQKQQEFGLPEHKIMGDVVTRWGSTYEMVSRILEQQQAISSVLAEDRKNWYRMPTDTEFSILEAVVEVLKPLSYLIDALSGEKQVTASAVLPIMKHVKSKLSPGSSDSRLAKEMKRTIWNDLETRYVDTEVSEALNISSFLDPRFKDQHLQNKEDTVASITLECMDNYGSIHVNDPTETTERHSTEPEDSAVSEPPPAKRLKGLAAVLKHMEQEDGHTDSSSTLTPSQRIDKEINSYLDFPGVESDTDPLTWWKMEQGRFPNLAKKYLCVCGTSVPSERVFSTAGHIANRSRGRLLPQNVSKLLFLAKNME